jgi:hypothetical protein
VDAFGDDAVLLVERERFVDHQPTMTSSLPATTGQLEDVGAAVGKCPHCRPMRGECLDAGGPAGGEEIPVPCRGSAGDPVDPVVEEVPASRPEACGSGVGEAEVCGLADREDPVLVFCEAGERAVAREFHRRIQLRRCDTDQLARRPPTRLRHWTAI